MSLKLEEEQLDNLVRDLTAVPVPKAKSEVRRLVAAAFSRIRELALAEGPQSIEADFKAGKEAMRLEILKWTDENILDEHKFNLGEGTYEEKQGWNFCINSLRSLLSPDSK